MRRRHGSIHELFRLVWDCIVIGFLKDSNSNRLNGLQVISKIAVVLLAMLTFVAPVPSRAQLLDPHIGATVKAGTTGMGVDFTKSLFQDINLRVGYNRLRFSDSITESGIKYDGDFKLESIPVFLDWHVFSGGFRMSAGAFYNNNDLDLDSRATGTVIVGNTPITASALGTLHGEVEFGNMIVPYLGVGWGNALDHDQRWGVSIDIGVFYQGKPDVTLSQSGSAVSDADLAQEERNLESALDIFQLYPVGTIGFFFLF